MRKPIEMIGMKSGELTVIKESHQDKAQSWFYECLCSCGNTRVCVGGDIRKGRWHACHQCTIKERQYNKQVEMFKQDNEAKDMEFIVRLEEILLSMQENERALQDLSFEFRQAMSERR